MTTRFPLTVGAVVVGLAAGRAAAQTPVSAYPTPTDGATATGQSGRYYVVTPAPAKDAGSKGVFNKVFGGATPTRAASPAGTIVPVKGTVPAKPAARTTGYTVPPQPTTYAPPAYTAPEPQDPASLYAPLMDMIQQKHESDLQAMREMMQNRQATQQAIKALQQTDKNTMDALETALQQMKTELNAANQLANPAQNAAHTPPAPLPATRAPAPIPPAAVPPLPVGTGPSRMPEIPRTSSQSAPRPDNTAAVAELRSLVKDLQTPVAPAGGMAMGGK